MLVSQKYENPSRHHHEPCAPKRIIRDGSSDNRYFPSLGCSYQWHPKHDPEETLHVDRNILLYDQDFEEMTLVERDGGEVSILIALTDEGTTKCAELTTEMVGKRLAITANNRILSAPVVQQPITGGSIQISGNITKHEAEHLIESCKKANQGS